MFTSMAWRRQPSGLRKPSDQYLPAAVGFTRTYRTFSTFEYEADKMLWENNSFLGLVYLFVGLAAAPRRRLGPAAVTTFP
jgi:fluoride ion exporter CrcB/FEX